MKLSQAVDLYVQRKRDAGMRFDSPTSMTALVSSPLWRYRSSPHHDTASHRIPRRFGAYAQHLERQTWHAAGLFRILDSTRSAEILSAAALCAQNYAKLRSIYLLAIRLTLASRRRAALPAEVRLCYVGSHIPHPVACFCTRTGMRLGEALRLAAHGC